MWVSRRVWIAAVLLPACSAPARRGAGEEWRYEVALVDGGAELELAATFPAGDELALTVGQQAQRFVEGVQVEGGAVLELVDGGWRLPASDRARSLRWRFHAREAARAIEDPDVAAWRGRGFVGTLSAFLLDDDDAGRGERLRLSVRAPEGTAFACALARDGGGWRAPADDLAFLPTCAFGAITVTQAFERGQALPVLAALDLSIVQLEPGDAAHTAAIRQWVSGVAAAIAQFYGSFPVERLLLILTPNRRPGLGDGRTRGYAGATIFVAVNARTSTAEFRRDWVLTHEMIHLAVPSLPRPQHWFEEGSAIYLEPLIRARAGLIEETGVWTDMLDQFPQGLARAGGGGLDHDHGWGRTYYGGALFFLTADMQIRAQTGNQKSLQDALAAVVANGGNVTQDGALADVLELGDRATGTHVLSELYERMKDAPEPLELDSTWKQLGVRLAGKRVLFDDAAPLADVRRALILGR